MLIENNKPTFSAPFNLNQDILLVPYPGENDAPFWEQLDRDLSRDGWQQLQIEGIGIFARRALVGFRKEEFPVHACELPFILALSMEEIRAAKAAGMNSLQLASQQGMLDWVEAAIGRHPTDHICNAGKTALIYALESRQKTIVHLLLEEGANANYRAPAGPSPLELAVAAGCVDSVRTLTLHGAVDRDHNALRAAIEARHGQIIAYLTKHAWHTPLTIEGGASPFHCAATHGHAEIITFLLTLGYPVNELSQGITPLHEAVIAGQGVVVKLLLDHGADPNIGSQKFGMPLNSASLLGFSSIARMLIEAPSFDLTKQAGWESPLYSAFKHRQLHMLDLLVPLFPLDADTLESLFQIALENDDPPSIKVLRRYSYTAGDKYDRPLNQALAAKALRCARYLLEQGENPHRTNKKGETAFHLALEIHERAGDLLPLLLDKCDVSKLSPSFKGMTLLHFAVRKECAPFIQGLIEKGMDINCKTYVGQTPLHFAAYHGSAAAATQLLELGADPNITDLKGWTPLHTAIFNSHADTAKSLLADPRTDKNALTSVKYTPLWLALNRGTWKIAELLLRTESTQPQSACAANALPWSPAVKAGQERILDLLIKAGWDVNAVDEYGYTPLYYASVMGHERIVRLLLNHGAYDNCKSLQAAIDEGSEPIIRMLVEHNLQAKISGPPTMTTLGLAAKAGRAEWIAFLAGYRASIAQEDIKGMSPVHHAARAGQTGALRMLLFLGAPPCTFDDRGFTPLHHAVSKGYKSCVDILMTHLVCEEINATHPAAFGWTALHLAAYGGHEEIFLSLIDSGADLTQKTEAGCYPLHIAAAEGHLGIVKKIVQRHPEQLSALSNNGSTPMLLAASEGRTATFKWLLKRGSPLTPCAEGSTPFHYAIISRNQELIDKLSPGADFAATDQDGHQTIHLAAMTGNLDLLSQAVARSPVDVHSSSKMTPLHLACLHDQPEAARFLLRHGADPHARNDEQQTPLLLAAINSVGAMDLLLDAGADRDAVNKYGMNILHHAIEGGSVERVEALLDQGENLHSETLHHSNALHIACSHKSVEMVDFLLGKGFDPSELNGTDNAPIHLAVKYGTLAIVKRLKQAGVSLSQLQPSEMTPLHLAAAHGKTSIVRYLLEHVPGDIHKTDNKGNTPLHLASDKGHACIIMLLLDAGAKPNIPNKRGETPLAFAASAGQHRTASRLLRAGADPNLPDSHKLGPLHHAATNNDGAMVELLLRYGADPSAQDNRQLAPIHLAALNGSHESIDTLTGHGVEIDMPDGNGHTPLHIAVIRDRADLVNHLLGGGANVHAQTTQGMQPIHLAAVDKKADLVKLLLKHRAHADAGNGDGDTPLKLAAAVADFPTVEALLNHGADPNIGNKYGSTPLFRAAENNAVAITKALLEHGANIRQRNKHGTSPIHRAASAKGRDVLQIFLKHTAGLFRSVDYTGNDLLTYADTRIETVQLLLDAGASMRRDLHGHNAITQALTTKNNPLIAIFQQHFPNSTADLQQKSLHRSLWHHLPPLVRPSPRLSMGREYIGEGGLRSEYFYECAKVLRAYFDIHPKILPVERQQRLLQAMYKSLAGEIDTAAEEPIFISSGFYHHSVVILIWGDWFCICNKGAASRNVVDFFQFDRRLLDDTWIERLSVIKDASKEEYEELLYNILPKALRLYRTEEARHLTYRLNKKRQQRVGNCELASIKMGLATYFVLDAFFQTKHCKFAATFGLLHFSKFNTFMKVEALSAYLRFVCYQGFSADLDLAQSAAERLRTKADISHLAYMLPQGPLPKRSILWLGSQRGAQGTAPDAKTSEAYKKADSLKIPGISFSPAKIKNRLEGGACSAMALQFAKLHLQKKDSLPTTPSGYEWKMHLLGLRQPFKRTRQTHRIDQVVLNTIQTDKASIDPSLQKARALAAYYGMDIGALSMELSIVDNTIEDLRAEIDRLPAGTYLLRNIQPANNSRLETKGHTQIYIKDPAGSCLYEPNEGLRMLDDDDTTEIYSGLKKAFDKFQVSRYRLYELTDS